MLRALPSPPTAGGGETPRKDPPVLPPVKTSPRGTHSQAHIAPCTPWQQHNRSARVAAARVVDRTRIMRSRPPCRLYATRYALRRIMGRSVYHTGGLPDSLTASLPAGHRPTRATREAPRMENAKALNPNPAAPARPEADRPEEGRHSRKPRSGWNRKDGTRPPSRRR
jgi:hypothetical protein